MAIANPADSVTDPRWRTRLVIASLVVVWLILSGRLVLLQLFNGDELRRLAERQRTIREVVPARPGDIVDRDGRILATTIRVPSLFVVPSRIDDAWDTAQQLADAIKIDRDALFERLAVHPERQFQWVKRRLTDDEVARVRQLEFPAAAWGFRDEYLRTYPQGSLAAQVLGSRDIDNRGHGGIEFSFDRTLRGSDGVRELECDARGRVIGINDRTDRPPQPGQPVTLTIDSILQLYSERAMDDAFSKWSPKSCATAVMDAKSGELLALASRPTFDPNQPGNAPPDAWTNRLLADMYEPGSTFKPFVVSWALKHEVIARDEVFYCENGSYRMGRRLLNDFRPYGSLNVVDILVKSSNIGMAKIGERLGNERLYEACAAYGFGAKTGIELPGESAGRLLPLKKWTSYSTGSVPMGQEIAVTPIQLLAAYGALSNGGQLVTPHVIRRDEASPGNEPALIQAQAIEPEIAEWVRINALREVVKRGTGKKADLAGFRVFGKTGTSQKVDPATGTYSHSRHVNAFVCGAPADDPRVLVIVVVDEPHGGPGEHLGGIVAAPIAADILHKSLLHLGVTPDGTMPQTAVHDTDDLYRE
jgi:cell division protein FtsI/penicillin-binding protein 2